MNKRSVMPLAGLVLAVAMSGKDPEIPADIQALLNKNGCAACHNMDRKIVGPAWKEIAAKKYSAKRISALVRKPEPGNWPGYVPMLAQTTVPADELTKISKWLAGLKP